MNKTASTLKCARDLADQNPGLDWHYSPSTNMIGIGDPETGQVKAYYAWNGPCLECLSGREDVPAVSDWVKVERGDNG